MKVNILGNLLLVCLIEILSAFTYAAVEAVVMPEYKGKPFKKSNFAIAPFSKNPVINNKDDVKDDLGKGDPVQVFVSFLRENLPINLKELSTRKEVIKEIRYVPYEGTLNSMEYVLDLEKRKIPLFGKKEQIRINLPVKGQKVKFTRFDADFILFLESFSVSRVSERDWQGDPAGKYLVYQTNFAIWENSLLQIHSYGRVESRAKLGYLGEIMTKKTWENATKKLAELILDESGLH